MIYVLIARCNYSMQMFFSLETAVEAKKKEHSSELLVKPSLGYIKQKVTIP